MKTDLMDISRQNEIAPLTPWFEQELDRHIALGRFPDKEQLSNLAQSLIDRLTDYRAEAGLDTVVMGMSGGVDSALTAALFEKAGWRVVGHTLPIEQDPIETARGIEACKALGIEHVNVELSRLYALTLEQLSQTDPSIAAPGYANSIRRGNLKARLRMITLYDQAHRYGGLVASTDNFSELSAGFWTLHGDVGDLAPIQSLLKSWEVPWISRHVGVPERTWRAKPTDGLGIDDGDEAQLGASYLQWDIMLLSMMEKSANNESLALESDPEATRVFECVMSRAGKNWHKRANPICLPHHTQDRYAQLAALDAKLFVPQSVV